jgi:hypothetical protein
MEATTMRRAWIALVALSMMTVFAQPAAASHSETKTYDLSSPGVSATVSDVSIGGVSFSAEELQGETPTEVVIEDATGGPVPYVVCQDQNNDVTCGGEGEPRVEGCGTEADLTEPDQGEWDTETAVTVFVSTASDACPGAVGTTGSVTLTFGSAA